MCANRIRAIGLFVVVLAACRVPAVVDSIVVGMPYEEAALALKAARAEPTLLAVQLPQRADGSFLQLECFEVAENGVLMITYDPRQAGRILELTVCSEMDRPRAERDWQKVARYRLRR